MTNAIVALDYLDSEAIAGYDHARVVGKHIFVVHAMPREKAARIEIDSVLIMTTDGPKYYKFEDPRQTVVIIPGGTPHRVRHGIGFWHINSEDEIRIGYPLSEEKVGAIVVQGTSPDRSDSILWFCHRCNAELYRRTLNTGTNTEAFWGFQREVISTFNADERLRTCGPCGAAHPLGYTSSGDGETAEEASARLQW